MTLEIRRKTAQKLAIFIIPLFLISFKALACTPAKPNPWYSTKLSFDRAKLPRGIDVVETHSEFEPYSLINRYEVPFYIIKKDDSNKNSGSDSGVPEGYKPIYKLTRSRVFYWGQSGLNNREEWIPNTGGINNSAATRVKVDSSIYNLVGPSKQVYKDDRPADVDIPSPQKFKILGYHEGSLVEITGEVHYSLNEDYDPKAEEKSIEECKQMNALPTFVWIGGIGILLILGGVIFALYRNFKANPLKFG